MILSEFPILLQDFVINIEVQSPHKSTEPPPYSLV